MGFDGNYQEFTRTFINTDFLEHKNKHNFIKIPLKNGIASRQIKQSINV